MTGRGRERRVPVARTEVSLAARGTQQVIYEVECALDPAVVAEFDAWLPGHVRQVLACRGFTGAEIQVPARGAAAAPVRRVQYRLEDAAALERYLAEDAARMRADGAARFGDKVLYTRRVLEPDVVSPRLPRAPVTCRNCGAAVAGSYCADCGQSGEIHVLTVSDVAHDVVHSVLHLDSSVWRTLRSLVLRPGELTTEFIAGRRQRYLPPFRLYLVLSVAFFALSALLPDQPMLRVDKEGNTVFAPITLNLPDGQTGTDDAAREAASNELHRAVKELGSAPGTPETIRRAAELAAETTEGKGQSAGCNVDIDLPVIRRLNPLLQEACRKVEADGGRRLGAVFISTAPKLMFLFLPLMAALAMLFYWKPRRLYAEHLVMFLHVHSFVFLWLAVNALINFVAALKLPLIGLLGFVGLLLIAYVPYYVFRAMRVVYGESRVRTAVKFVAISQLYFILLALTMAVGIVYSMLSL